MARRWGMALILAGMVACGGVSGGRDAPSEVPDADDSSGADEEASAPEVPGDIESDSGPPLPCPPGSWPRGPFAPFGELGNPMIQIHPAVVFDGQSLWWAFNLPAGDGSGNLSPWAARTACDGTVEVAPFPVATAGHNAVDPAVAWSEETVLVAWQADVPEEAPANMSVRVRAFDRDGNPRTSDAIRVVPRPAGTETVATLWLPSLAPAATGFLLSATLADPARGRFQALLSRLGIDGNPLVAGDGEEGDWMPAPEEGVNQAYSVAVEQDGLWIAWVRSPDEDPDQVQIARARSFGGPLDGPPEPFPDALTAGSAPVLASRGGATPVVILGASIGASDASIRIRQVHPVPPGATDLVIDAPGRQDLAPALALDDTGGAVAWFRIRSGYLADVRFQAFAREPGELRALGDEMLLNEGEGGEPHDAIAAYPVAITSVGTGAYLVSWVERRKVAGQDPRYQVMARFLGSGGIPRIPGNSSP
ncbi:hypothetical protein KBD49_06240 [Myxococcota bacterium]|nr:hypothetical protein [Myxococcota bacterium]